MKIVIAALNSKYIHSALAPWCLKSSCDNSRDEIRVCEFTINDSQEAILAGIFEEKADLVAFSCHIWNISMTLRLCSDLRKISPGLVIVLGGPEVSFDAPEIMEENSFLDFIICGEGERPFSLLIKAISDNCGQGFDGIPGLVYRKEGAILSSPVSYECTSLDSFPSPYSAEMLGKLGNRILYYESSRGCPFSCSYCLSSTTKGVRFLSLGRVKAELDLFFRSGVKQVKFVDRTFNCNKERALEIFSHIIGNYGVGGINFHFEIAADLLDAEALELLAKAPSGLIQIEAGIQSFNEKTLAAVQRKTDTKVLYENVSKLMTGGNINVHLDLIAGLPYEDFKSFGESFDRVYPLFPHQLQLGFLKLLKGSGIRRDASEHGYIFRTYPPYEVLGNDYLSYSGLVILKGVVELVDKYHNSGRFVRTIEYATGIRVGFSGLQEGSSPFGFYLSLYEYFRDNDLLNTRVAASELYGIMLGYLSGSGSVVKAPESFKDGKAFFRDLLKLDFLASNKSGQLPAIFEETQLDADEQEGSLTGINRKSGSEAFRRSCHDFLHQPENIAEYLPQYAGLPVSQILKNIRIEPFLSGIFYTPDEQEVKNPAYVLFDYGAKSRVTGIFRHMRLDGFPNNIKSQ
ncbi:MAG: B12-binding domain-containing radical SAM protein [Clostridiales bacterium]|nr:B12-binding domain-containing radical SAM protein [Clostridiales bacterium]